MTRGEDSGKGTRAFSHHGDVYQNQMLEFILIGYCLHCSSFKLRVAHEERRRQPNKVNS
jgi:hypothetical protein